MKKLIDTIICLVCMVLASVSANGYYFSEEHDFPLIALILMFLGANILTLISAKRYPNKKLYACNHGVSALKVFVASTLVSIVLNIYLISSDWFDSFKTGLIAILICFVAEAILFWNGMITVYFTSLQLGIKARALGMVFGMVPIINLFFLYRIIKTVSEEVSFECGKHEKNLKRKNDEICKTKYPLLMVHGVFFRDFEYFNYWGRIPGELEKNGARIFYGEHQSAASVPDSALELSERIKKIVSETGCEKLNIIAHSKGGLDCRYAIENCGIGEYVASLTTVNTPHRGCKFANYLLEKIPAGTQQTVASAYNSALRKLGDKNPDFMAAVTDLTAQRCVPLDSEMPVPANIYCQSIGSKLNKATSGKFPLNFSYHLVKHFDGANDGLVGEESFKWSDNYTFLITNGKLGISHGDVIDLNRQNIPGFDVREFFVELVSDLKNKGL